MRSHRGVEAGSARGTVIGYLDKTVAPDKIAVAENGAIGSTARANDGVEIVHLQRAVRSRAHGKIGVAAVEISTVEFAVTRGGGLGGGLGGGSRGGHRRCRGGSGGR